MRCTKCGKDAVLFQEYSGQHLCRQHFVGDLETKAKRAIRTHHWLSPGDHIAVGLSGDAATGALLYFLQGLIAQRRDIRLSAITVDEGIAGFRDPDGTERWAASLGIPCIRGSFAEQCGHTVDGIISQEGVQHACEYCRVIRRHLLHRLAREHGVTKLALGTTLDDGARECLTAFLYGDMERVIGSSLPVAGRVPVIQPFIDVPATEIRLYAALLTGAPAPATCPYAGRGVDADIPVALDEFTRNHPNTKHALVNLREHLADAGGLAAETIPVCTRCGEPCGDQGLEPGVCRHCGMIAEYVREKSR